MNKNRYINRDGALVGGLKTSKSTLAKAVQLAVAATAIGSASPVLADGFSLEEVVVTATRRAENIQDVPYNISAVTGDDLQKAGITDISGLARQIPGLTFVDLGVRSNSAVSGIIMRGLTASSPGQNSTLPPEGNTTVTAYINDTPLYTNLKIADVQHVEILRGPQGTLYGAGSVGGTLRFIFNSPSTAGISGSLSSKISQTEDADDMGYSTDGVINLPLSDDVALRVAAGYESYAGVTDATNRMRIGADGSPVLSDPSDFFGSPGVFDTVEDADESSQGYVRASVLWNMSDNVEALLSYHTQKDKADDFSGQNPNAGKRETTRFHASPVENKTELWALEIEADLGFATLSTSTSLYDITRDETIDFTSFAVSLRDTYYAGFPRNSEQTFVDTEEDRFVQEIRLGSNSDGDWDWVTGLYYTDFERTVDNNTFNPGFAEYINTGGHPWGNGTESYVDYYYGGGTADNELDTNRTFFLDSNVKTEEKAVFGELTYHVTEEWQVTGGFRYFEIDNTRKFSQGFAPCGSFCFVDTAVDSADENQIFKFNTSYNVTDDAMLYFTLAEGIRQGGANTIPLTGPFAEDPALVPYDPDTATNMELGLKGSIDNTIQYTVAIYNIDWKDVQLQFVGPNSGVAAQTNAGDARSQGLEMDVKAALSEGLTMTVGYAYTNAEITDDFVVIPTLTGSKGDKLPGVPDHQFTLAVDYYQTLEFSGGSEVHYHLDGSYRSGVETALNPGNTNYAKLDGFDMWNAAVTWSNSSWRVGAYVNNLTDEIGIVGIDKTFTTVPESHMEFTARPRTIGLMVGYSFE
ncbi:TonB-dependent receptor [Dasania marina]|uniref:TonB-dependent receptor n=1 Tax=Dasania marina TaxID=471499 RepID=UPI0030D9A123|tara:strand:- start:39663 stop:42080 length:2418 start_codon:yes stop_codon:yes gene_type:complete